MTDIVERLRERVARELRAFYSDEPVAVCDGVALKAADAAIALVRAEVLEEAARCAEDCSVALNGTYEAIHIAAAIRALKEET